jgi:hypothetical protein
MQIHLKDGNKMKIFKKLTLILVFFVLLFGGGVSADQKTIKDKINKLIYYIEDGKLDKYVENREKSHVGIREEVNISGFDYKFRWDLHYAEIGYRKEYFFITVRYYQEFTTPGHGFEEWSYTDTYKDGIIDHFERVYKITVNNIFIEPYYPVELMNKKWFSPSKEKQMEVLEQELDFWLSKVKGEKQ